MKQYLILARDGDDEQALERRKHVRPLHLEGTRKLKASGRFILGGAILDDEENMRGSVMIVQFASDEEFRQWYESEPYLTQGVWQTIEVKPFKVANV